LRWPLEADGANGISLVEAERAYQLTGAVDKDARRKVRQPRANEPVEAGWRPYDHMARRRGRHASIRGATSRASSCRAARGVPSGSAVVEAVQRHPRLEGTPSHELILRIRDAAPETTELIDAVETQFFERPTTTAADAKLRSAD
jgi:hypothetical protein